MKSRLKVVVLSGAGISEESGLGTFRGNDGLWDNYDLNEVATPEAWNKNPGLVLDFYNKRRQNCLVAEPNNAHRALAEIEEDFDVQIITQNIDDLHERSGSTKVLHLHGEILKAKSSKPFGPPHYQAQLTDIHLGDLAADGSQLRPHVVWFGEQVPNMELAERIVAQADIFIVIGTSLNVYPAAGLVYFCTPESDKYIVDVSAKFDVNAEFKIYKGAASIKVRELCNDLKMQVRDQ